MTLNPTARATARRNVADRIDRFLIALERAKRDPNRRELFWLREALAGLEESHYPDGENAMDNAERAMPIPEHAAGDPGTNPGMTVTELRGLLEGITRGTG